MGTCAIKANDNGFEISSQMDSSQLLYLQSKRKQFTDKQKQELDKAIQQKSLSFLSEKKSIPINVLNSE